MAPNQIEAWSVLEHYRGKTVQVLTSGFTANVNPKAVQDAVGTFSSQSLRGLEAKGMIKVRPYWKGATVEVLA